MKSLLKRLWSRLVHSTETAAVPTQSAGPSTPPTVQDSPARRPRRPPVHVTPPPSLPATAPQYVKATPRKPSSPPSTPPRVHVGRAQSPSRPRERTLIVGVDFGTSSTKVIWQDLSDNHFETFPWRPSEHGVAALLLPSAIIVRGDAIHFSVPDREACEGDIRLSSIKLCILCRSNPSICRCGSAVASQGLVRLPGLETAYPASAFACLFLAYVFREVERGLEAQFPDDNLTLLWNIGCPMDYLDETRRIEWEKMVGVAMDLHRQVANPSGIALLTEVPGLLDSFVVASPQERNYFVQPEGLAAVKAFLESPHAESKTYAIVDVGAGTTEVSFFFNGGIMAEPGQPLRPSYLADSTKSIGGGMVDLELAQAWGCTTADARRRKETGRTTFPVLPSTREICAQYENTCREILKHRRLVSKNNKQFDLFIIGGGGRLRPLQEAICGRLLPGDFVREGWRPLQPPKRLKDGRAIQKDYDLLANACGLASSLVWDYYRPEEVGSMTHQPPQRRRQDRDEQYPK
jgi:hypothetical protein